MSSDSLSDVDDDDDNNNSRIQHDLNNSKRYDLTTSRNFLDMSPVIIAQQLTIIDAVG